MVFAPSRADFLGKKQPYPVQLGSPFLFEIARKLCFVYCVFLCHVMCDRGC